VNAYLNSQTSGNQWTPATILMLHQESQLASRESLPSEPKQELALLANLERQMAAFEAEHDALLNEVRRYFVLPADSSVSTFLSGHRTIPQLLLEAAPRLRACFGAEAVFNLRAPVDELGSQSLYAVAMWPGNVRDVRLALAQFDDTWWIAHSRQAFGYLAFTYELV
jgi:hypothetical protein